MGSAVRRISSTALAVAGLSAVLALALVGRVGWLTALMSVTSVVYLAIALVGAAILRSRPRSSTGWIFLVSGVAVPVAAALDAIAAVRPEQSWLRVVAVPFLLAGVPLIATYGILLFPDRGLDTRPRRVLAGVYAVELLALLVWATFSHNASDPGEVNPIGAAWADGLVIAILLLGPLSLPACVSLLRHARAATGPDAPALRAAAGVAFVVPATYLVCVVVGMTSGATAPVAVLEMSAAIALGLAAWVGIVRYGLFDTRAVLSRALVFVTLSVLLAGVYLIVAVSLGLLLGGLVPQVIAAVAAALAVLPVRDLAHRRINQWVYGLRDEPAEAFARLGDRLDAVAEPEDMLPAAVRTVAEALRLPYVAIEVVSGDLLGETGRRLPGPVDTLPLPFAGETVGRLVWQDRAGGGLRADERRLLADLTRQVAVAVRAVLLTRELRDSRQRLVATREEERRRLRRDLHDGLGPTLAGIALGIDTVRRAAPDGGQTQLLDSLREATEAAVGDIRRIVYDLRPPILDELGLAGAVREQALRLGAAEIDVPETLPALPAAVEAAAYRIAVEALTNASRHAPGSPVSVCLEINGALHLSIADGGAGLPEGFRAGVGLRSMRERAAELGGRCEVSRRVPSGTLVRAEFPLEPVR